MKLQEFPAHSTVPQYLTLSHRWGSLEFLKLTKANVDGLKTRIELSELSKTFQDAIAITLELGLCYLWIDSLCIIQDCELDWLREAASMQDIYRNSILTISASGITEDGLESLRREPEIGCLFVQLRSSKNSPSPSQCFIYERFLWYRLVLNSPIARRGWVLQERLLSRRVLHCTDTQLAWECDELQACESLPRGIPVA